MQQKVLLVGKIYLFCIYFSVNNINYPNKKLAIPSKLRNSSAEFPRHSRKTFAKKKKSCLGFGGWLSLSLVSLNHIRVFILCLVVVHPLYQTLQVLKRPHLHRRLGIIFQFGATGVFLGNPVCTIVVKTLKIHRPRFCYIFSLSCFNPLFSPQSPSLTVKN